MKYTPEQIAVAKAQVVAEAKWRAASGAKNGRWRVVRQIQDGKGQEQSVSTPIFEGTRMYYRTPNYLYSIGEH